MPEPNYEKERESLYLPSGVLQCLKCFLFYAEDVEGGTATKCPLCANNEREANKEDARNERAWEEQSR